MIAGPAVRALTALVAASARRPRAVIALALALGAASALYTARGLAFQTSMAELLPARARYAALYREYLRDFGELNDILVVAESARPEVGRAWVLALVDELRRRPERFGRITYRLDPDYFAQRALLYAPLDGLRELRDRIDEHGGLARSYGRDPTLDRLVDAVSGEIARVFAARFLDLGIERAPALDLSMLESLIGQMAARLEGTGAYASPWGQLLAGRAPPEGADGFFASRDGRLLFVFVEQVRQAGSFTDNQARVEAIRTAVRALSARFPEVRAGVTGSPALSNDEMVAAFRDSEVAGALAFVATLALLVLLFRRLLEPLLMLGTLSLGLVWSLGVITATVGQLSIFSVMFISLMVGIGIDYGIYLLFRYQEARAAAPGAVVALARAAEGSGLGILLGAATAAGTFLVLAATEFRGIREFGVVSAIAILTSAVAMLTVFPAALALLDAWRVAHPGRTAPARPDAPAPPRRALEGALAGLAARPWPVLAVAALLTAAAGWLSAGVRLDYDMLNLQARGAEAVVWERKALRESGRSGFAAVATAASLDELRAKHEAFARLPSVSRVESVRRALPDDEAAKREVLREIGRLVESLRVTPPSTLDVGRLRAALERLRARLVRAHGAAGEERGRALGALVDRVAALERALAAAEPGHARAALGGLQQDLARDLAAQVAALNARLDPPAATVDTLPEDLRARFVGRSGRYLLRVYPAVDVWEREGARRFTAELRGVDPDVTGSPIIAFEAITLIERAYLWGTLLAFVLVAAVTALTLLRWRESVLALVPLVLGTVWTVGLMGLLGLPFNLANVWGLPLIVGASAEYGLAVVVRAMEETAAGRAETVPASTARAVLLNGLTTVGGFGTLMVASHQGIFSLGLLLTVGSVAGLVAALVVLPALLRLTARRGEAAAPAALVGPRGSC